MDAAVNQVQEVVRTLGHNRDKFSLLGIEHINKSMVIIGPQGSGKSNLAYSLAAELGYPTKVIHGKRSN